MSSREYAKHRRVICNLKIWSLWIRCIRIILNFLSDLFACLYPSHHHRAMRIHFGATSNQCNRIICTMREWTHPWMGGAARSNIPQHTKLPCYGQSFRYTLPRNSSTHTYFNGLISSCLILHTLWCCSLLFLYILIAKVFGVKMNLNVCHTFSAADCLDFPFLGILVDIYRFLGSVSYNAKYFLCHLVKSEHIFVLILNYNY